MPGSPLNVTQGTLEDLRERSRHEPGTLYAVLDACDEQRVRRRRTNWAIPRAVSLYRGSAGAGF